MAISIKHFVRGATAVALTLQLAACGGGGDASIAGTVAGLGTGMSVTLQNNNADNLTIAADQGFVFPVAVASGAAYSVSVLTQPVGGNCAVANGAGTVDTYADDVTNVVVTCSVTSSIGGTVTGLAAGNSVWLSSGGQLLPIAANGAFSFPGILAGGTSYAVTVSTQPIQQSCVVTNGSGVISTGVRASVSVNCG